MSDTENHDTEPVAAFIERWRKSGAKERANYQMFLSELCDCLGVPRPDPAGPDEAENAYVFDRAVTFHHVDGSSTPGFIDLYKRGCFVLETKQGSDRKQADDKTRLTKAPKKTKTGTAVRGTKGWDDAMVRARGQAEGYAKALPVEDGWPPLLIVADVGHCIELYSDFSLSGKHYTQFPDANGFRVMLADLAKPEIHDRLRLAWTDPLALDPARRTAEVTREIADRLARLAKSLEAAGHAPKSVATFLMRCLFTMFAEDVGLIPAGRFTEMLESLKGSAAKFQPMAKKLWQVMNTGGFSTALREDLLKFNGGLFADSDALPIDEDQLELLTEAARADWQDVEPAIFGTLLERALDPRERHKLGAHYTPRAYVERLVVPTVIEPLREEWEDVKAAAVALAKDDAKKGIAELKKFHEKLCATRVLDPACGSGNFLYVTMEHMKRLEGEVLDLMREMGETQYILELDRHTVDPHQFLGIEVNPRAAVIAELVLWIGYLQWHFRTRGRTMPAQPVLRNFRNIEDRDAVLAWDRTELVRDSGGKPVSRWDGRTTKPHPTTDREVPDETARVEVVEYVNPRRAEWPEADFIVGNPPYIGGKDVRSVMGEGYAKALWSVQDDVAKSVDFVMYWWDKAAGLVRTGKARRFGFITTNSLPQTFSRRVVEKHLGAKPPLAIRYAVPNHPWVDAADGAAVRVAMTVGGKGPAMGTLARVVSERKAAAQSGNGRDVTLASGIGFIHANLRIGVDITTAKPLTANEYISSPGVKLHGSGFIVTPEEARRLGRGKTKGLKKHIRPYMNGRDLTRTSRGVLVIDLFGLTADEVRKKFPKVHQWVVERVKPERDENNRKTYRDNWWIFGEPRKEFRPALKGLPRYIATVETAKHRVFMFLDKAVLPDNRLVNIALDDGFHLGVLSSRVHVCWTLASGGLLEDRPIYTKTQCFDPFPFPDCADEKKNAVRELGEQLDKHRKERMAAHPDLTVTGMYNVLEKLRAGEKLIAKERDVHDKGLVATLKSIHDDLDGAVLDAYGWPRDLDETEILARLVELNAERAAEERKGTIRWLRPEFQAPKAPKAQQAELDVGAQPAAKPAKVAKRPWPKALPEQVEAVRAVLAEQDRPVGAAEVAKAFKGARKARIEEVLETLAALGRVRKPGIDLFGL